MSRNLIELLKQQQHSTPAARPNPYLRLYGLRENPFPRQAVFQASMADPRQNGTIYDQSFRHDQEKQFFQMFVQRPIAGEEPLTLGFLRLQQQAGGRGNGKSAFLHQLMRRINEQDWSDWPTDPDSPDLVALAIHVLPDPRNQRTFHELIRLVFATLANRGLLAEVDSRIRGAGLLAILAPAELNELQDLPAEQLNALLADRAAFADLLDDKQHTMDGFVDAMGRLADAASPGFSANPFGRRWLATECSLVETWKQLQGASSFKMQAEAADWLVTGIMPILMVAGYRRFYLLLDEFERIYSSQAPRKRDEFLTSLRHHFFERDAAAVEQRFISVLLTLHPSVDRLLKEHWQRVGLERIAPLSQPHVERCSIPLGGGSSSQLDGLVAEYLRHFRATPEAGRSLAPFEAGALEPIYETARFFPGFTLLHARNVLEQAVAAGLNPPISRAFVESALKNAPLPEDGDDDEDEDGDDEGLKQSETRLSD